MRSNVVLLAARLLVVRLLDDRRKRSFERDVRVDLLAGDELQLVDHFLLARVRHRDEEPIVAHEHRQDQVFLGDLPRQQVQVIEAQAQLAEIDAGNAVLLTQGFERRDVRDRTGRGQARRQAAAFVVGERAVQLLGAERALAQQDLAELFLLAHRAQGTVSGMLRKTASRSRAKSA